MPDRVGLEPAPDDNNLVDWLEQRLKEADEQKEKLIEEFIDVVKYGQEEDEPYLFSYARLLNHLATLNTPDLIKILSAAIWEIMEADIT
jgi:hypothetical protein